MRQLETTDLALAAFLYCKEIELIEVRDIATGVQSRKMFVFSDGEVTESMVKDFHNNKATINPADYYDAIKRLKSMIFG